MNRPVVFYPLALLFCISFAPAQAGRQIKCELKEASILDPDGTEETYNHKEGHVYLYVVSALEGNDEVLYRVGNESSKLSRTISIYDYNTAVVKDTIIIKDGSTIITLAPLDKNVFMLYGDYMLTRENLPTRKFPVTAVNQALNLLENVSAIKARNYWRDEWIFVAIDDRDAKYFIIPGKRMKNVIYNNSDKEVAFSLEAKRDMPFTITFDKSADANTFYGLAKRP